MRRFLRGMGAIFVAAVILAVAAGAVLLLHSPVFGKGGGYELYLAPNSSALTLRTDDPARDKLRYAVKGESVRYDGDEKDALIERFRAKVLMTEEAAGVVNYYCFSPLLGEGTLLYGRTVNLHIAVSGTQTAVGTPLIFGGF